MATAFFGFSTVGQVTFRASSADSAFVFEPTTVDFTVDVDSLSALVPGRKTWKSAGEALDAICRAVFVDENGVSREQPVPLPLCTYMTVTLTTQDERAQAIVSMSPTGLSSQTSTALAGVERQKASVQSRLSALRGGGLRGAVDRLALTVDGVEIDGDAPAPAEPAAAEVAPQRERPWGFFVTGRLTRGDRSRGVEEDAFDFDTAGVTAGFDRAVTANGFLGFAVAGLRNRTDLGGSGGQLDTDAWSVTVYGIGEGERGYLQGTATRGQSSYDQRRRLPMPVLGDLTARAQFDGDQLAADLELGRSVDGRAGSLTAFVRGSWARASIDAFAERGAIAELPGGDTGPVDFGVAVDRQELDSLLGSGGLDWGKAFSIRSGLVIPQLTATWSHEFSNDAQQVRARFLGDTAAASSFFAFTDEPDRDWLTASAALRFQFLWGSFFVSYDHDLLRDDLEIPTINAGLRFEL